MKTLTIILLVLFIGLLSKDNHEHKIVFTAPKLKETPVKKISQKVETQLHILQNNMKKYDRVIKIKALQDSIIVIPDTVIKK